MCYDDPLSLIHELRPRVADIEEPMSKERILVVEDEQDIRTNIRLRLEQRGFIVLTAASGEEALAIARERIPDAVLLDLMLPGIGGLDVLKQIRGDRKISHIPVMILSALGEESDVVVGLEMGADDYMSKPFNGGVFVARVNALLRRNRQEEEKSLLQVGPIKIDLEALYVSLDDQSINLTGAEFRLLLALAKSKGRVLTRNQLIDSVLGGDTIVTERTIDVHVTALRSKLGEARKMIETVRGVGYRLNPSGDV